MRDLEVVVPTDAKFEQRLQRYDGIRVQFNLPMVTVARTSERTRLVFVGMPRAFDVEGASVHLVEQALGWLTRLERTWGEPLGAAVSAAELGFDPRRRVFSIGPGLFLDRSDEPLFRALSYRLGCPESEQQPLDGFEDLAVRLSSEDRELWDRIDPGLTDEERIRKLRLLARKSSEQGGHSEALEHVRSAWRLRPGDLALGAEILELSTKARSFRDADDVLTVVEAGAARSASLCLLLARYYRLSGNLGPARSFIETGTALEPHNEAGWSEAVRVYAGLRDRPAVLRCLERLALLGDEGALVELRKHVTPARWRQIVLGLEGAVSGAVLRWKLESLGQEERLQQLLFLFADNLDQIEVLGEVEAKLVLDAARRERGGIQRSLSALRARAHAGTLPVPFGRMFVSMCLMHGHAHEVLTLTERSPEYVSVQDRVDAFRELRRWVEVLELTSGRADFAYERLEAHVFHAQRHGERADGAVLRETIACLQQGERDPRLRALLQRLMEIAPDEPVTLQLQQLLGAP